MCLSDARHLYDRGRLLLFHLVLVCSESKLGLLFKDARSRIRFIELLLSQWLVNANFTDISFLLRLCFQDGSSRFGDEFISLTNGFVQAIK
jgi:hypothetical protein